MLLTSKAFNEKYKGTIFVKLINSKEIHNGYKFKTGLNVDIKPFNETGECQCGGFYFTESDKIANWLFYGNNKMMWMRIVTIPNDAMVFVEKDKFKTNKFILGTKKHIWSDKETCKNILSKNGLLLKYVTKQTKSICTIAVSSHGLAIKYVKKQNKKLCEIAISNFPCAYAFVDKKFRTNELWLDALWYFRSQ